MFLNVLLVIFKTLLLSAFEWFYCQRLNTVIVSDVFLTIAVFYKKQDQRLKLLLFILLNFFLFLKIVKNTPRFYAEKYCI